MDKFYQSGLNCFVIILKSGYLSTPPPGEITTIQIPAETRRHVAEHERFTREAQSKAV